jgi:hypothetical protein
MRYILIFILIFFTSCSTIKKVFTKKTKKDIKTNIVSGGEQTSKRPSDTIEIKVPKIVYKDTTIYKRGRASTVYINYDQQGNKTFGSICDSIDDFKRWYKKEQTKQRIKEDVKTKDVERYFKDVYFIYIFIIFVVIRLLIKYKIL